MGFLLYYYRCTATAVLLLLHIEGVCQLLATVQNIEVPRNLNKAADHTSARTGPPSIPRGPPSLPSAVRGTRGRSTRPGWRDDQCYVPIEKSHSDSHRDSSYFSQSQ